LNSYPCIEIKTVNTPPSILSLTPSSSLSSRFIRIHPKTMAVYDGTPPGDGATTGTTNTRDEEVTPRMMGDKAGATQDDGDNSAGNTRYDGDNAAIPRGIPRTTGRQPVEGERSEMGSANTSTPVFWVDYHNISPTRKTEKKKKI
jgi:hypothetical protein